MGTSPIILLRLNCQRIDHIFWTLQPLTIRSKNEEQPHRVKMRNHDNKLQKRNKKNTIIIKQKKKKKKKKKKKRLELEPRWIVIETTSTTKSEAMEITIKFSGTCESTICKVLQTNVNDATASNAHRPSAPVSPRQRPGSNGQRPSAPVSPRQRPGSKGQHQSAPVSARAATANARQPPAGAARGRQRPSAAGSARAEAGNARQGLSAAVSGRERAGQRCRSSRHREG